MLELTNFDELEQKQAEEKALSERNALQAVEDRQIQFNQEPQKQEKDKATQLVESAFNQAIIERVANNENVQKELLDSAEKVIDNKLNKIKSDTEKEDKEAHFNNKKGACDCFGYDEPTTEKWAVNVMNIWHNAMTAIWLFIGFFTFAPITFIAKKIGVIFKKAWVAVVLAIVIYLAVILIPLLTGLLV